MIKQSCEKCDLHLKQLLGRAEQRIKETGGISHEALWASVEELLANRNV